MASGYIPLPAAQVPRNAMADFSGINSAIDDYTRNTQHNAMFAYEKERDLKTDARANAQLGIQQAQNTRAQQTFDQAKADRLLNHYAGVVQMIDGAPPEQQASMWQRVAPMYDNLRKSDPDFDREAKMLGFDPNDMQAASRFIVGRVRGYQDPLKAREAEAGIGLKEAQAQYYQGKGAAAASGMGKAPSGYRWSEANPGQLEAIEGGPASKLPADTAGKIGMMRTSLQALPTVRNIFLGEEDTGLGVDDKTGRPKRRGAGFGLGIDYMLGRGDVGEGYRLGTGAIESVLRAASGAAVPESEVERYAGLFLPAYWDTNETKVRKIDALERWIGNMLDAIQSGRPIDPAEVARIGQAKTAGQPPAASNGGWSARRID